MTDDQWVYDGMAHPLPQNLMDTVRDTMAATVERFEPEFIAVVALTGSPERGLALSCSSKESYVETIALLAHAISADPLLETIIEESGHDQHL